MKECELCSASARMYWNRIKRACAGTCQSTGAKLGPTVSLCERCMKGNERGGRVADEESHNGNEIEALYESAMSFVPVHRSDARTDGVGVRAVYEGEGERRRSRGGEPWQ
ncbi:hypothetical protein Scep_006878 [Stephania cephalantha]|uniref:Uncharacterized protein n=1 Tax=Stephania cephalantha TaxID=152367 RepID=A0AAP0PPG8_9MAGN